MDASSREIIANNEKLLNNLDLCKLEPYLKESKIFTNSMLRDIYKPDSKCSLYSELPSRGPEAFTLFLDVLKKAGYNKEMSILSTSSNLTKLPNLKKEFYPMKSKPLGYCVIINNMSFAEKDLPDTECTDAVKLEYRHGSEVDVKNVRKLFEQLGYIVVVWSDLNGRQITRQLKEFSGNKNLPFMYCCFVVVLSHGGNINNLDVIYGLDEVAVSKNDIIETLNNINCESLRMKPKVFVFQACRGKNEDEGVYSKVLEDVQKMSNEYTDSSETKKIAMLSDTFVIHSALPYHKSYRRDLTGSWLIEILISVLSERCLYDDFQSMMNEVEKKVQERVSFNNNKQVIHTERYGVKANFHICSNEEFKGYPNAQKSYLYYV